MSRQTAPRVLTAVAIVTTVASGIGLVVTLVFGAFGAFSDDFKKYGEVPIPGSASLHLPAGDVTVSFHTILVGGSGSGLPVPAFKYRIVPPEGVTEPVLTEDYGSSTTVNNGARRRVGYGNVSAFLDPSLAFGPVSSGSGNQWWIWGVTFGVGLVGLLIARVWAARVGRQPVFGQPPSVVNFGSTPTWAAGGYVAPAPTSYQPTSHQPTESFTPSDEGIRVQSLNSLARLRDSGALTNDEYEAEKKRVLEGP